MWWLALLPFAAEGGTVTLTTSDQVALTAQAWGTSGTHGVLLLHGLEGSHGDWVTLGPRLAAQGLRVLAPDLRGHGASKGSADDLAAMTADVAAGVAWLADRGATSVHLVGASAGANLALHAASAQVPIGDVVLLSPQPRAPGLPLSSAVAGYGDRPLLVVASRDDVLSAKVAGFVHARATGPKHIQLYDGSARGYRMLNAAPDLEPLIVSWITGSFRRIQQPDAPSLEVRSSGLGTLETEGVRLDERRR